MAGDKPRKLNAGLALTRLLQLSSPALPVGAYSYSQGLEAAVEAGTVHDAARRRSGMTRVPVSAVRKMRG